jgi:propionate catabolism operon transcriptional regulator
VKNAEWLKFMQKNNQFEGLHTIGNKLMLVTRTPIIVDKREAAVLLMLQNTEEIRDTESRIRKQLRSRGLVAKYKFQDIVGEDESMKKLVDNAIKYSKVDSNVLIIGESGTGKELFAQSIHNASIRSSQPFVAINCAALPEQLLESELFGYAEGSFSGASKGGKIGLFEQAHKGTIFLDEIGEMPLPLQAKLLRVLQEKEIRRIGDDRVVPVDVRVISATNIDFANMLSNRQFRLDLYYRINLLNIHIPPLRQHPKDIIVLFRNFIEMYLARVGLPAPDITIGAINFLEAHTWPGNVRELQNICERIAVIGGGGKVDESVIQMAGLNDSGNLYSAHSQLSSANSADMQTSLEYLEQMLTKKRETKAEMAKRLGISRSTLWRRLKDNEIKI